MSALGNGAGPQLAGLGLGLIHHHEPDRHEPDRHDPDRAEPESVLEVCAAAARLVRELPVPLRRLSLRIGECAIELEFGSLATGSATEPVAAAVPPPAAEAVGVLVRAPLVGTFYLASGPGAEPFVRVGEQVEVGQTIGIVEAMKLMNPVVTDVAGTLLQVLAGDGESVEYDQPLIALDPGRG